MSSRPWGFEFVHAYISLETCWADYGFTTMYLDMRFEALKLNLCDFELRELTVWITIVITAISDMAIFVIVVVVVELAVRGVVATTYTITLTANLPTKILDSRGFDSSRILI